MAEKAETWRRSTASKSLRDSRSTMAAYVLRDLGSMHVRAVATSDVKRVLRPPALAGEHATARTVAGGSRRCWSGRRWGTCASRRGAAGRSLRRDALAAEGRAVQRHRARHFSDVAAALVRVDGHPRIGRSVQFAVRVRVLTAARQVQVHRATWDEFDVEAAVWTVPEAHIKRDRPHRVPLSTGTLAVDEPLSEFALAHVEGSKAMAAYARDDLLEKRRPVMQAWSDFIEGTAKL